MIAEKQSRRDVYKLLGSMNSNKLSHEVNKIRPPASPSGGRPPADLCRPLGQVAWAPGPCRHTTSTSPRSTERTRQASSMGPRPVPSHYFDQLTFR